MSQVTKTFTKHPQNSMILMNGAVLECFPKESHQGDFVPDQMKLDTTGVYLSIGNKPCKPQPSTTEEKERQKKLFTDNAFYLLAHQERIMRDSRMFFAPVAVQNGLAYIGTRPALMPPHWAYTWNGGMNVLLLCEQARMAIEASSFILRAVR